jgi:hypothetical protein
MSGKKITVQLTDNEYKALAFIAYDPLEWSENVIKDRARLAMLEIFDIEMRRMMADPDVETMSTDIEVVVNMSTLPSAKEIKDADTQLSGQETSL